MLLEMDGLFCVHHNRNIHAMGIYKGNTSIGPEIMNEIFMTINTANVRQLRSQTDFFIPQVNTVHFGYDSLRHFGPKLLEI